PLGARRHGTRRGAPRPEAHHPRPAGPALALTGPLRGVESGLPSRATLPQDTGRSPVAGARTRTAPGRQSTSSTQLGIERDVRAASVARGGDGSQPFSPSP